MVSYAAKPQSGANAYAAKSYDQTSYAPAAEVYTPIPQPVFIDAPIVEEVSCLIFCLYNNNLQPEPVPPPRPCFPLVSFGFGGKLLVMIPRGVNTIESPSPNQYDVNEETVFGFGDTVPSNTRSLDTSQATAGNIAIVDLKVVLRDHDERTQALLKLNFGPLDPTHGPAKQDIISYCERSAEEALQAAEHQEWTSAHLLWKSLALLCRHNGRIHSTSNSVNAPENMV